MKREIISAIFFVFFLRSFTQVSLIYTGTSSQLTPISVIGQNIVVNGVRNYLVKSYDECNTLIPLPVPSPTTYWNYLDRVDTNVLFLLSTNASLYNNKIYKSGDGGYTWVKKSDTTGMSITDIVFFDANEGIAFGVSNKMMRTKNEGISWSAGVSSFIAETSVVRHGDSSICVGGIGNGGNSFCLLSKDRGNSWYGYGAFGLGGPSPRDFSFVGKDTIFGISSTGSFGVNFIKTSNGGANWVQGAMPIKDPYAVFFKKFNEGYIVGQGADTTGIILKTTDMGQSWHTFDTKIKSILLDIKFINDSMALISGTNGVLFKWNSKRANITGISTYDVSELDIQCFPNPFFQQINIKLSSIVPVESTFFIFNSMGEIYYSATGIENPQQIDTSNFPKGIYFMKITNSYGCKLLKVVKE